MSRSILQECFVVCIDATDDLCVSGALLDAVVGNDTNCGENAYDDDDDEEFDDGKSWFISIRIFHTFKFTPPRCLVKGEMHNSIFLR